TNSTWFLFSIFFVSTFITRTYYTIFLPVLREKVHLAVTFFDRLTASHYNSAVQFLLVAH
ncbi:MAG: hypothetical protein KHW95_08690, partial [Firmicutes bacterium]|nr:hypothetical protein [Bacillota bacterium]